MNRLLRIGAASLLLVIAGLCPAFAQSTPGWTYGQVPTTAQWNAIFASKQDLLAGPPLLTSGGTMTGPLRTAASTTASAGFTIPAGTAPTSPFNGDMWLTSVGLFVRLNGVSVDLVNDPCATCAVTNATNTFTAYQKINLNVTTAAAPQTGTLLQLNQANSTAGRVEIDTYAGAASFIGLRSNGTAASPTTVVDADELVSLGAWGYDATARGGPGGAITIYGGGTWSNTSHPTRIYFATTAAASTTLTNRLLIESDGGIVVGPGGASGGSGTINLISGLLYANGASPTGTGGYARAISPTFATSMALAAAATGSDVSFTMTNSGTSSNASTSVSFYQSLSGCVSCTVSYQALGGSAPQASIVSGVGMTGGMLVAPLKGNLALSAIGGTITDRITASAWGYDFYITGGGGTGLTGGTNLNFYNTYDGGSLNFRFYGKNTSGVQKLGALINCGLAVNTAGAEDGDCDFLVYRLGDPFNPVACMAMPGTAGTEGFRPCNDNVMLLGGAATHRWANVFGVIGTFNSVVVPGTSSGSATITALSGTTTFRLPPTNGTSGWFLQTDGSGNTSWVATTTGTVTTVSVVTANGISGSVATATTTPAITLTLGAITPTSIGAYTLAGTIAGGGNQINNVIIGTSTPLAAFFTTLSATTSIASPLHIGGTGTTGIQHTLQTTTGNGTTDSFSFKGGNNGATTFATLAAAGFQITSAGSASFAVGRQGGSTGPAFSVDSSTGTQTAGLKITGAALNGTVAMAVTDTSGNTNLSINALNAGTITIGTTSTGSVTIGSSSGGGIIIEPSLILNSTNGGATILRRAGSTVYTFGVSNGMIGDGFSDLLFYSASTGPTIGEVLRLNYTSGAATFSYNLRANGASILFPALANAATTSAVCFNTGTGLLTYNGTVGTCTVSTIAAKTLTAPLTPQEGFDIVMAMQPWRYAMKEGRPTYLPGEQIGMIAEYALEKDARLVAVNPDGSVAGFRYEQYTAALTAAFQQLKADNDNLREEVRTLRTAK